MDSLATTMTTLLDLTTTVMGLFSEFPLNIILVGSLAGVGFNIFGHAKHAAS